MKNVQRFANMIPSTPSYKKHNQPFDEIDPAALQQCIDDLSRLYQVPANDYLPRLSILKWDQIQNKVWSTAARCLAVYQN